MLDNLVKNVFTITDLENLSGIKAHTIRIWERRYSIFSPQRGGNNRRSYDSGDLRKLLNIKLLQQYGYKISKIGLYTNEKLQTVVREIVNDKNKSSHAMSSFKFAMMNFDQELFFRTYENLLSEKPFSEIFYNSFVPLLEEIGLLWQTQTITPAHEHFISFLIRQKVLVNVEKLQLTQKVKGNKVFFLFLPENEMHSLGLLYAHYMLTLHGYKSIFLGENIPMDSLVGIRDRFDNVVYVSYFTIAPPETELNDYICRFKSEIMDPTTEFWILGRLSAKIERSESDSISVLPSLNDLLNKL